jgi:hypothetical protein
MDTELLLALGFVIFFVAIIALGIGLSRRSRGQRDQAMTARGFRPLAALPPELAAGLAELNPVTTARNIYRLDRAAYLLYLVEWAGAKDSGDVSDQHSAVLTSPDLRLPHFAIFPRLDSLLPAGWMGNLAQSLVNRSLVHTGLHPVELENQPVFERYYTLLGQDDAAMADFFTLERCNRLANTRYFSITGKGNLLTFSRLDTAARRGTQPADDLLEGAQLLFAVFRE